MSRSGSATPIVLVPNAAPPFRETFSLDTPSTKTHCLVRMRSVIVEPNLWNVVPPVPDGACAETAGTGESGPPAEGSVSWSYRDRVLSMRLDVTRSSRGNGGAGPVGYPEIYYGYSPYAGVASSPMPSDFELPSTIGGLPDVVLRTGYTSSGYASTDSNLAYDMFITSNDLDPSTAGSPNSWCGTGIENPPGSAGCLTAPSDVLEVMIWLADSPVDSSYTPATRTDAPVGEFSPTMGLRSACGDVAVPGLVLHLRLRRLRRPGKSQCRVVRPRPRLRQGPADRPREWDRLDPVAGVPHPGDRHRDRRGTRACRRAAT